MLSLCAAINTCFCFGAQICSQLVVGQENAMLRVQKLVTKKSLSPTVIEAHRLGKAIASAKTQSMKESFHLDPRFCLASMKRVVIEGTATFHTQSVLNIHFLDTTWDSNGSVSEMLKDKLYGLKERVISSDISFKSYALLQLHTEGTHKPASLVAVLFFFLSCEPNGSKFLLYLCPGRVKVLKNIETVYKRIKEESESLAELSQVRFRIWNMKYQDVESDLRQPVESGGCQSVSNNDHVEYHSIENQHEIYEHVPTTCSPSIRLENWENNTLSTNNRSLPPTPVHNLNEVQQRFSCKKANINPLRVEDNAMDKIDLALHHENVPFSDAQNVERLLSQNELNIIPITKDKTGEGYDNNQIITESEQPEEILGLVHSLEVDDFDENTRLPSEEIASGESVFRFVENDASLHLNQAEQTSNVVRKQNSQTELLGNGEEILTSRESHNASYQLPDDNTSTVRQLGDTHRTSLSEISKGDTLNESSESKPTSEASRDVGKLTQETSVECIESQYSEIVSSNGSLGNIRLARDHYRSKLGVRVWWELEYQSKKLENRSNRYGRRKKPPSTSKIKRKTHEVVESMSVEVAPNFADPVNSIQKSDLLDPSHLSQPDESFDARGGPVIYHVEQRASLREYHKYGPTNPSHQKESNDVTNTINGLFDHETRMSNDTDRIKGIELQITASNGDNNARLVGKIGKWAIDSPMSTNCTTFHDEKAPTIISNDEADKRRLPQSSSQSSSADAMITNSTMANRVHELRAKRLAQLSKQKLASQERAGKAKHRALDNRVDNTKDEQLCSNSRHNHTEYLRQKSTAALSIRASRELTIFPRRLKKASNRQLIQNAIEFTLLAGAALEKERRAVLNVVEASCTDHFIVLLKSANEFKFRALYEHHLDRNEVAIAYGPSNAPPILVSSEIGQFFRYNSGKKEFMPVDTRSFTIKTDACALLDHLVFRRRKNLSSFIY